MLRDYQQLEVLGCTRDDAAGEAFDKVARVLELGYPEGIRLIKLLRKVIPMRLNSNEFTRKDSLILVLVELRPVY